MADYTSTAGFQPSGRVPVEAHTASYTCTPADFGKILTTRGAGAEVVFTLPAAVDNAGYWIEFYSVADQNMKIAAVAGEMVHIDDLTGNSISFETASEKIGGAFRAVCDGTSWLVVPMATETQTITLTT